MERQAKAYGLIKRVGCFGAKLNRTVKQQNQDFQRVIIKTKSGEVRYTEVENKVLCTPG